MGFLYFLIRLSHLANFSTNYAEHLLTNNSQNEIKN